MKLGAFNGVQRIHGLVSAAINIMSSTIADTIAAYKTSKLTQHKKYILLAAVIIHLICAMIYLLYGPTAGLMDKIPYFGLFFLASNLILIVWDKLDPNPFRSGLVAMAILTSFYAVPFIGGR
jgi:hypothetical protein